MRKLTPLLLAVFVALTLWACSEESPVEAPNSAAPNLALTTSSPPGAFYPMSPGNRWTYEWRLTTQLIPEDGPPEPPELIQGRVDVEQGDVETYDGREYVRETERYSHDPGMNSRLYRQDRAGLYLLDRRVKDEGKSTGRPQLSSAMHSAARRIVGDSNVDLRCVEDHLERVTLVRKALRGLGAGAPPPGGVADGEIQSLAYPLRPGATWVIRPAPFFVATVEAHDRFLGIGSYRVRIDSEFLGDDDAVHVWYSRCGDVGWRYHFSSTAYSPEGIPLGLLVSDESADVIALDVGRGGCTVADSGDRGGGNTRNYPMAVGNLWTYEVKTRIHQTGEPPIELTTILDDWQEEWVEVDGRTYIKQVLMPRGPAPWTSATYLRQDREGLYSLDPPNTPAGKKGALLSLIRAAAAPDETEAVNLAYPLKTGASWTIRDSELLGLWRAKVESRERLSLAAGDFATHRIRITHPDQRANDVLLVWYGDEGLLKAYQRVLVVVVDENGNVIKEDLVEEEWELQSLELVK